MKPYPSETPIKDAVYMIAVLLIVLLALAGTVVEAYIKWHFIQKFW